MQNLISKELHKLIIKQYGGEYYSEFQRSLLIVAFDKQLPIKEEILSIVSNKITILNKIAEAVQQQIVECNVYMLDARTKEAKIKWTKALQTHYDILERLLSYIEKIKAP